MKKLLILVLCLVGLFSMAGCVAEEGYYGAPPGVFETTIGTVEFCDDWGCRMITAPYYYYEGDVVYWDAHFGCWIGPRGYWLGGDWHHGWIEGYHGWYGGHFYHRWVSHPQGWRAGSGFHGYGHPVYHGGGGHHR